MELSSGSESGDLSLRTRSLLQSSSPEKSFRQRIISAYHAPVEVLLAEHQIMTGDYQLPSSPMSPRGQKRKFESDTISDAGPQLPPDVEDVQAEIREADAPSSPVFDESSLAEKEAAAEPLITAKPEDESQIRHRLLKALLDQKIQRMHEDHGFFVKHILREQRRKLEKQGTETSPTESSPQRSIKDVAARVGSSSTRLDRMPKSPRSTRTLNVVTHSSAITRTTSKVAFKVTKYRSRIKPLPKDNGYHSRLKSHVTMDCGELKYQYDDEGMELEGIEDINEAYEDEVDDITTRNQQQERASKCQNYVSAFLDEAGSSLLQVAIYLAFNFESDEHDYQLIKTSVLETLGTHAIEATTMDQVVHIEQLLISEMDLKLCDIFPPDCQALSSLKSQLYLDHNGGKGKDASHAALDTYVNLDCLLCYRHECLEHGKLTIENDEPILHRFSGPSFDRLINANSDAGEDQLLGSRSLALLSIIPDLPPRLYESLEQQHDCGKDLNPCSEECHRNHLLPKRCYLDEPRDWSKGEEDLLSMSIAIYGGDDQGRWACVLSEVVSRPCIEVFRKGQAIHRPIKSDSSQSTRYKYKALSHSEIKERTITASHLERPGFQPCCHQGPCMSGKCSCVDSGIMCEKSCFCSKACHRRYRGCSCQRVSKGTRRLCWQNSRCECYDLNRECDPDLCGKCGACEILDPLNRDNKNLEIGGCNNISLQKGNHKRLLLGRSELEGNGAFTAEPGEVHDFVGEYTGEIITEQESQRRGRVYDARGQSYIFTINEDRAVDASTFGTKVRFINHSQVRENCVPKVLFVNGTHRIGIWLKAPVDAGDELFMNYGEEFIQATRNIRDFPEDEAAKAIPKPRSGLAGSTGRAVTTPTKLARTSTGRSIRNSSKTPLSSPAGNLRRARLRRGQLRESSESSKSESDASGSSSEEDPEDEDIRPPIRRRLRHRN